MIKFVSNPENVNKIDRSVFNLINILCNQCLNNNNIIIFLFHQAVTRNAKLVYIIYVNFTNMTLTNYIILQGV
jgi:hypothetical protein